MSDDRILRPLDPGERFVWLADAVSSMNFVVIVELSGTCLTEDAVRSGLSKLQRCHPLLASRISQEQGGAVVFRSTTHPVPIRVQVCSEDDWCEPLAASLGERFNDTIAAPARCHLLRLPTRTVLGLTFRHAIADGRSGIDLVKELVRFCLRGIEPSPVSDIPPPMHSLFPSAFQWAQRREEASDLARRIAEEALIVGPPTELPFLQDRNIGKQPRIESRRLDHGEGERLQSRCREEAATVHGAICAAQIIATQNLFEGEEERTFHIFSAIDLRPYISGNLDGQLSYCSSGLGSSYRLSGGFDFWSLAREVGTDLKRRIQRGDGHLNYASLPLDQIGLDGATFESFKAIIRRRPMGSNISNVGRVATLEDCPEIEAISFALCSFLAQHLTGLYVSSYGDQLIVNQTYDATKVSPSLAKRLADDVLDLLSVN